MIKFDTIYLLDCDLENCRIKGTNIVEKKEKIITKSKIKNEEIICSNLFLHKGNLFNSIIEGKFDQLYFQPDYCKNIEVGDIIASDLSFRLNCNISGGLIFKENINTFIAGLTLLTDDYKYIKLEEILKKRRKLKKYFDRREI